MIGPVTVETVQDSRAAIADPLRRTAEDLERSFVQEMLKHAGLAEAFAGSSPSQTADAFSGFLLEAVAEQMTEQGGFGLADRFYRQLAEATGGAR